VPLAQLYEQGELRGGLDRVANSVPVGHGYVEALAGMSASDGAFARVEAGYHPLANLSLFADAEDSQARGAVAGVGARWSF
jgi:hypothetical protein